MAVKKLIEVALPLDAINAASAREKSIRHGHPSTLHLWWARRPLATARAVIWASLVDDPSSHVDAFPTKEEQDAERSRLFKILEELVIWENSNDERVLKLAKQEIRNSMGTDSVALLDPFAGGGAIPLEAQRLGLRAIAHDLNPVAVTINKAMIEIPPLFADHPPVNPAARKLIGTESWEGNTGLVSDIEYYAKWMRDKAFEAIGAMYPKVRDTTMAHAGKRTVLAWLWARTVKCPNPACGCITPLARTFDLSKARGKQCHVEATTADGKVSFEVKTGKSTQDGTVARRGARCIHCGQSISFPYIRQEASSGRMGSQLLATVAEGERGRLYLSPDDEQTAASNVDLPESYPSGVLSGKARVNVSLYGFDDIQDLFTNRQLTMLSTLADCVKLAKKQVHSDAIAAGMSNSEQPLGSEGSGAKAYGDAIGVYLAFIVDKLTDYHSSICSWNAARDNVRNTFGRQAIPMTWDYAENNPFSGQSGSIDNMIEWVVKCVASLPSAEHIGCAKQFDAQSDAGLRNIVVSTDPPYYDNIDYADLSDYFYIWMRRSLRETYPDLFRTMLVPKSEELVATPYRFESKAAARIFFEEDMYPAFKQVNEYARDDVPVTIYYAFKQSETETVNQVESTASTGWETMLSAIIKSGFSVVGTWPMRTERQGRTVGLSANALASSIVLVCRKRSQDAPMATRRDFVNSLKRELKSALEKLQTSNIAPVDLAQSAIGPGIGVYSRFSSVLEADGSQMTVRAALQIINQELDLYFSDQDNDLDRESRFCVDLYTQSAFNEIRFGEADVLARAKNTSIEGITAKGALSSVKGVVRLLGRDEIREMPSPDFCWLFTQQLTKAMETGGIEACAKMLKDVYDSRAENAKALAYRLFTIADKKGWAQEAFAYNSLVAAWPDIQARAAQLQRETPVQTALDI